MNERLRIVLQIVCLLVVVGFAVEEVVTADAEASRCRVMA